MVYPCGGNQTPLLGSIAMLTTLEPPSPLPSTRRCTSITDLGLGHLTSMPNLRQLCLRWCANITDGAIAHLLGMTRIRQLSLAGKWGHGVGGMLISAFLNTGDGGGGCCTLDHSGRRHTTDLWD